MNTQNSPQAFPQPQKITAIAEKLYALIARNFAITALSDEFYYFPQAFADKTLREPWDAFDPERIKDFIVQINPIENALHKMSSPSHTPQTDLADQIDIRLLIRVVQTLKEQLSEIRSWESQPTFYLLMSSVGMADALTDPDPSLKHERAQALPRFLDQGGLNLKTIPRVYQDLALEMLPATHAYLKSLIPQVPDLAESLDALKRFEEALKKTNTRPDFMLPLADFEHIVKHHLNCETDLKATAAILDHEIAAMESYLNNFASESAPSKSWQTLYDQIPLPRTGSKGLIAVYEKEVLALARHCVAQNFITPDWLADHPVQVLPVPAHLMGIRTASSYSMNPAQTPPQGVFYVIHADTQSEAGQPHQKEYQILSAHETYPGHHLLDAFRWENHRAIRKPIEMPVYYEGWACFSENLMALTGYYQDPLAPLMIAKRRLWRAIRGKIDLKLQTGQYDFNQATHALSKTGIPKKNAQLIVRKYTLNPGYQLCYTLGLNRFLSLYEIHGQNNPLKFVRDTLNAGEIGFSALAELMRSSHDE